MYEIMSQICLLKQEGHSILEYYSRLNGLRDELENFLDVLTCTCAAATLGVTQREKKKAHQFLMGLNHEYSAI